MEDILGAPGPNPAKPRWQQEFESVRRRSEEAGPVPLKADRVPADAMPYQRDAIEIGVRRRGRLWLCDEQGLGKTVTSLLLMAQYAEEWPLLVVCPKSVLTQWGVEARTWLGKIGLVTDRNQVKVVKAKKDCTVDDARVVIVSYDVFARNSADMKPPTATGGWGCVVLDEAHKVKDPVTKRTKAIMPVAEAARRCVLLTGTPYVSGAADLWPQLKMSALPQCRKALPNYQDWRERYCEMREIYTGNMTIPRYTGCLPEMRAEVRGVLEAAALRRTKESLKAQLPSKFRQSVFLEPKNRPKVVKLTRQFQEFTEREQAYQQCKDLGGGDQDDASNDRPATHEINKLFTQLSELKVDSVLDWLDDSFVDVDSDDKFIVFAHHKSILDTLETGLAKRLDKQSRTLVRVDGSTSQSQRDAAMATFKKSRHCRCAVLSITACGTGIDMSFANNVVFAEVLNNFSAHVQAEDRVHRVGQRADCNIYYCLLPDSLDDITFASMNAKLNVSKDVVRPTAPRTPPKKNKQDSSESPQGGSPSKRPRPTDPRPPVTPVTAPRY